MNFDKQNQPSSSKGFWGTLTLLLVLVLIFFASSSIKFTPLIYLSQVKLKIPIKPKIIFDLKKQTVEILGTLDEIKENLLSKEIILGSQKSSSSWGSFWLFNSKDQINILVLGIAGEGHFSPDLTDSIVFVHLDKAKGQIILVSIPRDLLVKIPNSNSYTKINALYSTGLKNSKSQDESIQLVKKKVEDITSFEIDNYIVLDLKGLEDIVDTLGGLNFYVKEDVYDPQFPTPDGGYEVFEIKQGWHYLDGKTVVKYVRTRHSPRGDFARMERQQEVFYALRKKGFEIHPIFDFPKVLSIFNSLRNHIWTNFGFNDMKYFLDLNKNMADEDIKLYSLASESVGLVIPSTTLLGGKEASIVVPRAGIEKYEEIQEFIRKIIE